jgi:hypothetical protein
MILATLGSASVAALPPERFATGSGIYGMSRQIGTVIGVAVTVALLAGTPDAALDAADFHPVWGLVAALALATAVAYVALGRVRVRGTAAEIDDPLVQLTPARGRPCASAPGC